VSYNRMVIFIAISWL